MQLKTNAFAEIIKNLHEQLAKRKDLFFKKILRDPMTFVSNDNLNIQMLIDGIECFELLAKGIEEIAEEEILRMWFETAINFFENYYEINQFKKPTNKNKIQQQIQEKIHDCYQQL